MTETASTEGFPYTLTFEPGRSFGLDTRCEPGRLRLQTVAGSRPRYSDGLNARQLRQVGHAIQAFAESEVAGDQEAWQEVLSGDNAVVVCSHWMCPLVTTCYIW